MKLVVGRQRDSFEKRPKSAVGCQWVRSSVDIEAVNW